jgi:hypothetical protein
MPRPRSVMRKIREVLRLTFAEGLSRRLVGIAAGLPEGMDDSQLEARLFVTGGPRVPNRPLPDWLQVHRELRRPHVTLQLLQLEYRDKFPEGYGCRRTRSHSARFKAPLFINTPVGTLTFPKVVDLGGPAQGGDLLLGQGERSAGLLHQLGKPARMPEGVRRLEVDKVGEGCRDVVQVRPRDEALRVRLGGQHLLPDRLAGQGRQDLGAVVHSEPGQLRVELGSAATSYHGIRRLGSPGLVVDLCHVGQVHDPRQQRERLALRQRGEDLAVPAREGLVQCGRDGGAGAEPLGKPRRHLADARRGACEGGLVRAHEGQERPRARATGPAPSPDFVTAIRINSGLLAKSASPIQCRTLTSSPARTRACNWGPHGLCQANLLRICPDHRR